MIIGLFSYNKIENRSNSAIKNSFTSSYEFIEVPNQVVNGSLFNTKIRFNNLTDNDLTEFSFELFDLISTTRVVSVIPLNSDRYDVRTSCSERIFSDKTKVGCQFFLKSGKEIKPRESVDFYVVWKAQTLEDKSKLYLRIYSFCLEELPECTYNFDDDSRIVNIVKKSDLSLTSNVSKMDAFPGETISHTLVASNSGLYAAYDVELDYWISSDMEFLSFDSIPPSMWCDEILPGSSGKIHCQALNNYPFDIQTNWELKFTTKIRDDIKSGSKIINLAKISSLWVDDQYALNNNIIDSVTIF